MAKFLPNQGRVKNISSAKQSAFVHRQKEREQVPFLEIHARVIQPLECRDRQDH